MRIQYDDDTYSEMAWLLCPLCGGNNLHQGTVVLYERNEDAKGGVKLTLERGGNFEVNKGSLEGNPSIRRHGMRISFQCENCDERSGGEAKLPDLVIYQHKGNTYLEWEIAE